MATVKYHPAMGSDIAIPGNAGRLLDHDDTSAELTTMTGDTLVFTGQGFTYVDDTFVGGTVTEIVYKASDADRYRVTDINWSVTGDQSPVVGVPAGLFDGNDIFIGSRIGDYLYAEGGDDSIRGGMGDDYIRGGEGNDILRGGRGNDVFIFALGDGTDRIIDFDARGPKQDVLRMTNPDQLENIEIYERFHSVVIEYGDGDRIILRNTDLDDLSHKNFDSARHFDLG